MTNPPSRLQGYAKADPVSVVQVEEQSDGTFSASDSPPVMDELFVYIHAS